MAGKIVSINVKQGQTVANGDLLIVLEAMKMNTQVPSPLAGVVREICVKPGDNVEEGHVLVVLE